MYVIGIDEVGRGSIAGPLVVGAVGLDTMISGLKDSKLLTRLQRENLAEQIKSKANYVGLGWVSSALLDKIGLTAALKLASRRAIIGINRQEIKAVIIDGNLNFLPELANASTLVDADALVPAVSAASIIAKVSRDQFMHRQALVHNCYGFERNVGYGTPYHLNALKEHGPCPLHRVSFEPVKSYLIESTA